ncbi:TM0106 family RecB-like putative nuclease [Microbacterium sediminicola]|uniref:TM0106 family RecB-like putative nuclease n=1 Tax=Microbacterium sediminicola TaxID=415210 RepID=A0ABP4UAK8_9MICO
MRYIEEENRVIWSASDLKAAAECEFAWLRALDAKLGRVAAVEDPEDLTLERAGRLGGLHERRVLEAYGERFPGGVAEIPETRSSDAVALAAAVAQTSAALASNAEVLYQAAFSSGDFVGFADFLVRDDEGRWLVQDTKLARRAKVTALMQLAAYVDQLDELGVPRADDVQLLLGDGAVSTHAVDELMPVFELRRGRLRALIDDRLADDAPIAWGDERGDLVVTACGRCATCELDVVAQRDLLLVAGMRPSQRQRLRAAGVRTIDDLAAGGDAVEGMNPDTLAGLRTQARLQLESPAGIGIPVATGERTAVTQPDVPRYEVIAPRALAALPRPDHGDIFFDFEGDPLYTERADGAGAALWGLDYLFGWVDTAEQYSALWAHSFTDERAALGDFLDYVALRREQFPGMHIYHYAPYEPTHLAEMAARYGVREGEVDRLLRDGVFVDLYPIVRRALRVGSRSYSIKKLEPLYMGDQVRTSDVQRGDDSIVRYVEARALEDDGDAAGAQEIFDDLADYNRYDCVSTLRLRNWLVDRAREAGLHPSANPEPTVDAYEPSLRAMELLRLAEGAKPADAQALRLAAAAIDYYPREAKSFWATHFLRLREPISLWQDTRDVVVTDALRSRVLEDWHLAEGGRSRVERRRIEIRGEVSPGTRMSPGSQPYALYEMPAPFPVERQPRRIHEGHPVTVISDLDDGFLVEETAVEGFTWQELPVALTPASPPRALSQQTAIDEWSDALIAAAPGFPRDPAVDILRRMPARLRQESGSDTAHDNDVDAVTAAVLRLDHSALSVQGPPGTGKTYVGSHVIARLVAEHGYRVGVVAQSHAVVEHMLDRVVAAGVPASQVAKAPKDPEAQGLTFTTIRKNGVAAFAAEHDHHGYVVGGTAWDFSNDKRIPRRGLDLLVIDEAGQFSLAATIAVSVAAPRLLLIGDPQQLPQVSQGTHPEPVDVSALGWIMADEDVIRPEFGRFLAASRRMHPAVTAPVSQLSYRGALHAHPSTALRSLEGVEPGLVPVPVPHRGCATESEPEAAVVAGLVRDVLGRAWTDVRETEAGDVLPAAARPLGEADIIVVTPYNAQQALVESTLAAAGFPEVRVGTVDRFQGQEAAVAIVSLAASSGRDAPRGIEFLLLRNRLNVAISRAMHTAYLVSSPGLLDDLPRTPEGVARLSAFAHLVRPAPDARTLRAAQPPSVTSVG